METIDGYVPRGLKARNVPWDTVKKGEVLISDIHCKPPYFQYVTVLDPKKRHVRLQDGTVWQHDAPLIRRFSKKFEDIDLFLSDKEVEFLKRFSKKVIKIGDGDGDNYTIFPEDYSVIFFLEKELQPEAVIQSFLNGTLNKPVAILDTYF